MASGRAGLGIGERGTFDVRITVLVTEYGCEGGAGRVIDLAARRLRHRLSDNRRDRLYGITSCPFILQGNPTILPLVERAFNGWEGSQFFYSSCGPRVIIMVGQGSNGYGRSQIINHCEFSVKIPTSWIGIR